MTEGSPDENQDTANLQQESHEWLRKGNDYVNAQHYGEALEAYEQALHLNPNDVRIYVNKGIALDELGRYEEALAAYEQALSLSPNDTPILVNKGADLDALGRYEEALAVYERALQLKPDDGLSWYNKGNTLRHLQRYKEALAAYERAVLLDPDDARFHGNKGDVLDELGRSGEALTAYEQALHLDPHDVSALVGKGVVLEKSGQPEAALTVYEQALLLDPNRALIWVNKGNSLFALQRYEDALAAYEQALSFAPKDANAESGRESAREKLGRDGEATLLPFPKTFSSHPKGRYRVIFLLVLLVGLCFLGLTVLLLKFIITPPFLNHAPFPLLLGMIGLTLLALLLAGFFLRTYYYLRGSKLTLTREGILYNAVSFKMYTPWKNVRGVGRAKYGILIEGLTLHEPALMDSKVGEGRKQGVAVIELTTFMLAKKRFQRLCPFRRLLPVDVALVGRTWLQGEFGSYLRQYAPQIFEQ